MYPIALGCQERRTAMALDSHKIALLVIDVQNEHQKQRERRKEKGRQHLPAQGPLTSATAASNTRCPAASWARIRASTSGESAIFRAWGNLSTYSSGRRKNSAGELTRDCVFSGYISQPRRMKSGPNTTARSAADHSLTKWASWR